MLPTISIYLFLIALSALSARLIVGTYARRAEPSILLRAFRVAYGAVLACEVLQLLFRRSLIRESLHVQLGQTTFDVLLLLWLASLLGLIGGFHRSFALLNFIFGIWMWGPLGTSFIYHADQIYLAVNAVLVFAPLTEKGPVSAVWSRLIILAGIAFMYFDSALYKWHSVMWTSGLGVWKPASYPQTTWLDTSLLLDHKLLMLGLGYTVLIFETVFVGLMWFERIRIPLILIGVGLHLGIALVFPIPWFGLVMVVLFIIMLPPRRFALKDSPSLKGEVAWKKIALTCGVAVLLLLQLTQTARNIYVWRALHLPQPREFAKVNEAASLFGMIPHQVFLDWHFHNTRSAVNLTYLDRRGHETALPIYRENGQVHPLASGRFLTTWLYQIALRPTSRTFCGSLRDLTPLWAAEEGVPADTKFRVKLKPVDEPMEWQAGWLKQQMEHPWKSIGTVQWAEGQFNCSLDAHQTDEAE